MKFTHQIKFNSVPEWREHYIHYGLLKKILYQIAKADADILASGTNTLDAPSMQDSDFSADAEQPLLRQNTVMSRSQEFEKELDREVGALIQFYLAKEAEMIGKLEAAELEIHSMERQAALGYSSTPDSTGMTPSASASELQPEAGGMQQERMRRIRHWAKPTSKLFGGASRQREKLKGRLTDIFVGFYDLINFLDLNKEGLRKILKKHDKVTGNNLRERYWREVVDKQYPSKNKTVLDAATSRIIDQYAVLYMNGDILKAQEQLSRQLRDQIQVERNTVWRDMVAMERRTLAASVRPAIGGSGGGRPWWRRHGEWIGLGFSLLTFFVMLSLTPFDLPEKNNCLALLVFVSLLWSTEALPLFVTSMLLPLLIVALRVLVDHTRSPPERLTPQEAAAAVFHAMFSQVIMLLLGGFAIAAALSKHFIAKQVAIAVLSRVGRKPQNVLLACMMVATFASMWISNVAAPVLCFSLVQPILRTLDTNHPFAKALVIGIALASNIGGMTSPISSPQNIFAIERMSMDGPPPSWLQWFAVALPVSIIGNLLCWAGILFVYQPWRSISEVRPLKPSDDHITVTQIYVITVSLATVALWCANSSLQSVLGEMGVVAIVPLVGFFGFGILNKDDFNGFLWNVVMLAMGGLALGEAVKSSGLLAEIADRISILVAGMDLWAVTAVFCALVLVCTTFISHTVGAMVILPIVQSVGEQMTGTPHPKLLVMAAALMCSGAMGLPVSGFPNMNAVALEDTTGTNYISTIDFLKVGVPGSIAAYGVIVSLGYCLMQLVGL